MSKLHSVYVWVQCVLQSLNILQYKQDKFLHVIQCNSTVNI
uniref:Uncharacterized protein n=1 Tax=Anguilla anguilla TaxID=7936 RepID=A0A0E9SBJ6_ANGAN